MTLNAQKLAELEVRVGCASVTDTKELANILHELIMVVKSIEGAALTGHDLDEHVSNYHASEA